MASGRSSACTTAEFQRKSDTPLDEQNLRPPGQLRISQDITPQPIEISDDNKIGGYYIRSASGFGGWI